MGSCRGSEATIFIFHPVKVITSAEGRMVTTNDKNLAKKLRLLRSHGLSRKESELKDQVKGPPPLTTLNSEKQRFVIEKPNKV